MPSQSTSHAPASLNSSTNHSNGNPSTRSAEEVPNPFNTTLECFKEYAKARPEVVSLWAFGIGFVLGWRLKPW